MNDKVNRFLGMSVNWVRDGDAIVVPQTLELLIDISDEKGFVSQSPGNFLHLTATSTQLILIIDAMKAMVNAQWGSQGKVLNGLSVEL